MNYKVRCCATELAKHENGKQIVATIAKRLTEEFGTSFTEKNIRRMMQFAAVYADERIVVPLIRYNAPQSWPLKRDWI